MSSSGVHVTWYLIMLCHLLTIKFLFLGQLCESGVTLEATLTCRLRDIQYGSSLVLRDVGD